MNDQPSSSKNDRGAGPTLFIVALAILIGSILLFLLLRPNSSTNTPKNSSGTPHSQVNNGPHLSCG
jgi:hypothetical protein